jgi:hypothetical protein
MRRRRRIFRIDSFGFGQPFQDTWCSSTVSRRTIDFMAAFASSVVESTLMVSPLTSNALSQPLQQPDPRFAGGFPSLIRRLVREIVT